jgi:3-methyladenine DNA glycosylase AlkD
MNQATYKYHGEILQNLKANKGTPSKHPGKNYGGNNDPSLHIRNQTLRLIVEDFASKHQGLTLDELLGLLDLLYKGKYDDEKQVGGKLLQHYHLHKKNIKPMRLNVWLDHLYGWSQVDSLCQSVFSAEDIAENWNEWKKVLINFSKDTSESIS